MVRALLVRMCIFARLVASGSGGTLLFRDWLRVDRTYRGTCKTFKSILVQHDWSDMNAYVYAEGPLGIDDLFALQRKLGRACPSCGTSPITRFPPRQSIQLDFPGNRIAPICRSIRLYTTVPHMTRIHPDRREKNYQ
jgi:hypothetical protein